MLTPEVCEAILRDHYRNPRHRGACEGAQPETVENPACGDIVTLSLAVSGPERSVICARFVGAGCAASQAGASLVLGMVQGKPATQATHLLEHFCSVMESGTVDPELHFEEFGDTGALLSLARFPARVVCATLAARQMIRMLRPSL
ncbi:nitrogen fixation NifU-like protein [Roseimicrobium gellanilyticum]|uniref:Nitrogen fixation NifU-like protein n=1 Tax=Roseimicrobium gellanilyticum TaxID=748857 RepID=A0A366H265_9BACT|nr:SUF system NifU family Fe-S cluster assembly protein [Roseimicrobium gellanilyticum]RBP35855.1 nitrogen fixation NifU-like protein [Roseimicrobium gellanilyticum]